MELVLPNNYVALEQEEMMYLDGGLSIHNGVLSFGINAAVNATLAYFMGGVEVVLLYLEQPLRQLEDKLLQGNLGEH